ncbi:MAG TPA: DciA family protein, partial [Paludibacteraceae bacterium]|nr:DciA family protein [Paludibacteraceae bacterium]
YKTLGSTVKKYTTNIYVNDKKLFVKLNSSVLKNDLMMSRSALVTALNNKIGVTVINEIIFI